MKGYKKKNLIYIREKIYNSGKTVYIGYVKTKCWDHDQVVALFADGIDKAYYSLADDHNWSLRRGYEFDTMEDCRKELRRCWLKERANKRRQRGWLVKSFKKVWP